MEVFSLDFDTVPSHPALLANERVLAFSSQDLKQPLLQFVPQ